MGKKGNSEELKVTFEPNVFISVWCLCSREVTFQRTWLFWVVDSPFLLQPGKLHKGCEAIIPKQKEKAVGEI